MVKPWAVNITLQTQYTRWYEHILLLILQDHGDLNRVTTNQFLTAKIKIQGQLEDLHHLS